MIGGHRALGLVEIAAPYAAPYGERIVRQVRHRRRSIYKYLICAWTRLDDP
jgi:hypothetical protein